MEGGFFVWVWNDFVKDHSHFHSLVNLEGGMIEFLVERNHLGKVLFQLCF